ncbi:MAG TPA: DUF4386 domain-containing protein [Saprospiraceae bacterium]|nr:DUF4386 domain-containing protein [Saprospiraceae bacterium]
MTENIASVKKTARLAGLLYLIWIITAIYGEFYVPSRIHMQGDAVTAAQNILSNEFLFRTGILNDVISSAIWVLLVLVFYRLFKSVNERLAKLMVALVIVQIPTVFMMEAFNITSLIILKGDILQAFELSQRQDLAMLFLKIDDYGVSTLVLFWGLWLFPLAILVYRSHFLPRFLGIWLIINGFAYLVLSFTSLLFPQYRDIVFKIGFPAMLGEIAMMLWLLIKGVKNNIPAIQGS